MLTEKLLKLVVAGGSEWVMLLLIALSVLSLAIIFERALFFRRRRAALDGLDGTLTPLLGRPEQLDRVRAVVAKAQENTLTMALAYEGEGEGSAEAAEKLAASAIGRERLVLEKRLGFLGTLGSNAPFIGLFGTVLGVIRAFNDLSLDSKGGSSAVMAGISEALVATAIGLFVAIPAVMAYNYFQREVDHIEATTESLAQSVLALRLITPSEKKVAMAKKKKSKETSGEDA
ncbi:MAG: MotA/TolQ/ExbB proton channel family protein [Deltaproteobacteria bacterium]|nr:MotA/TolQ/ExbB proton channel family protein [Deltaproteobacteria bacterium]